MMPGIAAACFERAPSPAVGGGQMARGGTRAGGPAHDARWHRPAGLGARQVRHAPSASIARQRSGATV